MKHSPIVLVTGASGFTGQHACRHFSKQGMTVIPMYHSHRDIESVYDGIVCELTNERQVAEQVRKIRPDYVLHLAGRNAVKESWEDPVGYVESNFSGTLFLLEALRKSVPSCRTLIVGSALQYDLANENPPHPYSLSKTLQVLVSRAWEQLMGMDVVIAKPSNLIGPGGSKGICSIIGKRIADIEKGKVDPIIEIDNLGVKRDFLDVRDAVSAYSLLLLEGAKGEAYEIGSGINRSLREVIGKYKKLSRTDFEVKESRPGTVKEQKKINVSQISKLGWLPEVPFSTSLNNVLNDYR